jgi:hypothetical protein
MATRTTRSDIRRTTGTWFARTPWSTGPNIKRELFRADGTFENIWDNAQELSFSFLVPVTAAGDGLFRV